ncbi:hypothetical protein ABZ929_27175 [Streptomyces physcomitrii]|uniref:hypothetical protein n=1 Tax=Streptomyces physcomitrii TaxID=2724184 RepID=UPI003417FB6F
MVDRAEIAAAQKRPRIDRDHDGSVGAGEAHRCATAQCARLADQLRVVVRGNPLPGWRRPRSALSHHPGQAGLETSRLSCALTAAADLRSPAGVTLRTGYDTARIGRHEVTARGEGATVLGRAVTATVPTATLTTTGLPHTARTATITSAMRTVTITLSPATTRTRTARPQAAPTSTPPPRPTGC